MNNNLSKTSAISTQAEYSEFSFDAKHRINSSIQKKKNMILSVKNPNKPSMISSVDHSSKPNMNIYKLRVNPKPKFSKLNTPLNNYSTRNKENSEYKKYNFLHSNMTSAQKLENLTIYQNRDEIAMELNDKDLEIISKERSYASRYSNFFYNLEKLNNRVIKQKY